jgi:hypothetical protein
MDDTVSGSGPMSSFGISGAEPSGCTNSALVMSNYKGPMTYDKNCLGCHSDANCMRYFTGGCISAFLSCEDAKMQRNKYDCQLAYVIE